MNTNGKQNISKASQVERARQRLEKAVARLDQVILAGMEPSSDSGDSAPLADEVNALKAENTKLRDATRSLSGRLDETIDKLKNVLES